jgi:hypothetical protein
MLRSLDGFGFPADKVLLGQQRTSVLKKAGGDPRLIRHLLTDAGLWINLQASLKAHVETAYKFTFEYRGRDSGEEALNELPSIIREFNDLIWARLEGLNTKSQELIQTVCPTN